MSKIKQAEEIKDCNTCYYDDKESVLGDICMECATAETAINWKAKEECYNCLYYDNEIHMEPCPSCHKYDKWESKDCLCVIEEIKKSEARLKSLGNHEKGEEFMESIKPPLGLIPRYIAYAKRLEAIKAAINRYMQAGLKIPIEWIEEYNFIILYDETRLKGGN